MGVQGGKGNILGVQPTPENKDKTILK